jgi:hypothetical protein
MATFTPEQRARILFHLEYPNMDQIATLLAGQRCLLDTSYTLDRSLELLRQEGFALVLDILAKCERAYEALFGLVCNEEFDQIDRLKRSSNAYGKILRLYNAARIRLANALGAQINPYALQGMGTGGTMSGRWRS